MADLQDPVLPYPSSRVISPLLARRSEISTPISFSVPSTTGNSQAWPLYSRRALDMSAILPLIGRASVRKLATLETRRCRGTSDGPGVAAFPNSHQRIEEEGDIANGQTPLVCSAKDSSVEGAQAVRHKAIQSVDPY